jgi:glutaminase
LPITSPILAYLEQLHARCAPDRSGAVADYIPELAQVDPELFGICLAGTDGYIYEVGDTRERFTIQSMSKPLTYGLALEDRGLDVVATKVGVEPSGDAFNSISLQPDSGRPLNPMINAGAISSAGLVAGDSVEARFERVLGTYSRYAGRRLDVDEAVYESELETGHRNRAIGHMLRTFDILDGDPNETLELYFRQCAIAVDCRDVSLMAATLANAGINPVTGEQALSGPLVDRVLSVMTTCGMYDYAGGWVVGVGMPAKSGVGGGVMAVLPGQLGVCVFSPRLDEVGNSVRGVAVCTRLSEELDLHFVDVARSSRSIVRARYDLAGVPSSRRRPRGERDALRDAGRRCRIYELQGDMVFAAIEGVMREIVSHSDDADLVIVDLRAVSRLEPYGRSLFEDLGTALRAAGKELVIVDDRERISGGSYIPFYELDAASEWCEGQLLDALGATRPENDGIELRAHQFCEGLGKEQLERLDGLLATRTFIPGEIIVTAGDPAQEIFLLMRGEVAIVIDLEDGTARRLSTLTPGMTFGETALLGEKRRTANVRGEEEGELRVLTAGDFDELAVTDPALQAALLRNLLAATQEIVGRLTTQVASLSTR